MERVFAGVFGRDAGVAGKGVGAALDVGPERTFGSPELSLSWSGPTPVAGRRLVVLSGRVRNAAELASELEAPAEDDELVVSKAIDRWGQAALSRLRGSFALLAWDDESRSGLLAVDQLGAGGLFLHESNGALTFATEVRDLLRTLPKRPVPDTDSVTQWVADGQLARGTTLYEGVRRLEGGTVIHLTAGRWREESYWTPRFVAPAPIGREDAGAELRASLSRSVATCIGGAETVGVQVSGGLDSSLLAALTREVGPSRVTAYSLVHPAHPEIDESAWIERVTSFLGLPGERIEVRGGSSLAAALEYQLTWELPAATAMLAFSAPLLHRAGTDDVGVLLDGEGGDELLGCSEYVVADRIRRLDIRGAIALARLLPGAGPDPGGRFLWALVREFGLRGAAPHAFHAGLRRVLGPQRYAPRWLERAAARTYVALHDDWAWKRLAGPPSWSYLADLLTAGRERIGVFDLLRRRAAQAGVRNVHPLLEDLDLVELVLRLPPALSLDPALTRPLAREAMAGSLPDDVRLRPDKVDFTPLVVDALGGPDRPLVETLLRTRDAEVLAYVRPDSLARLLDTPPGRRSSEWARVVARLATTECWLRSQGDPGLPRRLLEQVSGAGRAPRAGDRGATA